MNKIITMLMLIIFSINLNAIEMEKGKEVLISFSAGLGIVDIKNNKKEFGYFLDVSAIERFDKTNYFYGYGISFLDSQDHYKNISGEAKIGYNLKDILYLDIITKIGIGYAYNEIEKKETYGMQYSIDNTWSFSKTHSVGYKLQINDIDSRNTYTHIIYFSAFY